MQCLFKGGREYNSLGAGGYPAAGRRMGGAVVVPRGQHSNIPSLDPKYSAN